MPSTTPTDDLIQAVVLQLSEHLPALVAAEDLPAITGFLNHDPAIHDPTKAPLVWVDVSDDLDSTEGRRGASLGKAARVYSVLVGVTCAGQDAEQASRRIRKCIDLIIGIGEGDMDVAGTALWFRYRKTEYSANLGAAFGSNQLAMFKEAIVYFEANRRRSLGHP